MEVGESQISDEDARETLRCLFDIATSRLRERSISIRFSSSVIDYLLDQPGWRNSINPLSALDYVWHQQVANVLEQLLLDRNLQEGETVHIEVVGVLTDVKLQISTVEG